MSCNLYNGRASPAAVGDALDRLQPDVVIAQELGPRAAAAIEARLPHGALFPSLDHLGVGIALRHEASVQRVPMARRHGLRARLEPSSWSRLPGPLEVLNVHLTNPLDRPWGSTRVARAAQVRAILARVPADGSALIVLGDLNSTPLWPAFRDLRRSLRDGIAEADRDRRTWAPFPWMPALLRIDHALVHGPIRIMDSRTVRIHGSDHRAIVVDVGQSAA